jgi:hypothetical protein
VTKICVESTINAVLAKDHMIHLPFIATWLWSSIAQTTIGLASDLIGSEVLNDVGMICNVYGLVFRCSQVAVDLILDAVDVHHIHLIFNLPANVCSVNRLSRADIGTGGPFL